MAESLRVEENSDRVVAVLDRPETRNAIDQELVDALHALCARLEADPRVLILTGSGGVFASGADIRQLRERRADDARRGINTLVFERISALPMPVIAAIDGYALGGGAELAYAADLRIGTPAARIGNPEPGLGILPAAGATWRLPRLVGDARSAELLFTGRILTGDEALAWGLLSAVHEPDELMVAAQTLADRIARQDRLAIRHTKTAWRAPIDAHPAIDLALQAELFESPEKHRRMTEFLERKNR
ncbi:MAG TPA: enoyl-CoA hydratase/isomerase family protein [Microbacterium sp.]|uniref:enoyl-CoA hydratase/isomerase family protein n=1 Tax=Microbacterium sp. TaxID=51671 RepID=UPI002B46D5FF|nr:enoyl-CoA hydratase/isomerase family protein [Microbacterium sp.]HKT57157.1 enoyl-CoA hydratase/isomerase family protein [Microbacterium sp.]